MTADAASARALIRSDLTLAIQKTNETINDRIDKLERSLTVAQGDIDKRVTLIEKGK